MTTQEIKELFSLKTIVTAFLTLSLGLAVYTYKNDNSMLKEQNKLLQEQLTAANKKMDAIIKMVSDLKTKVAVLEERTKK